jgi:glycerol kinase
VMGLTRGATRKEIARAALESVGFQTDDLIAAMTEDFASGGAAKPQSVVRVDGGMAASDWTMQFLADIVGAPVDRPTYSETTALGAAFLAGWRAGLFAAPDEFAKHWRLDRRFAPAMDDETRRSRRQGWRIAVEATLHGVGRAP